MKKLIVIATIALVFVSCKEKTTERYPYGFYIKSSSETLKFRIVDDSAYQTIKNKPL